MRFSWTLPLALASQVLAQIRPGEFTLRAFGEGINGLEIFDTAWHAYAGDSRQYKENPNTFSVPIVFFVWDPQEPRIWTTDIKDVFTWSDSVYYLPGKGNSSTPTGFESKSKINKDLRYNGFVLDGDRAYFEEDGKRLSNWFVLPVEGKKDIYSVHWGTEDVEGRIDVILSKAEPKSAAV